MKRTSLVILAIIVALIPGCISSFNSGDVVTVLSCSEEGIDFSEERTVGCFDSFSSYGPFNVYYVQSESQKVLVEGKEEFVKKVKTEVSDKELSIKLEKGIYNHLVLRVTVYSPNIEDIAAYGSGGIYADSIVCEELSLSTSGSGGVRVTGRIVAEKDVDIETQGSGSVRVNTVSCNDLEASTFGSGGISIEDAVVSDEMDLSSTGSGSISVYGKCRKVKASTTGSGSIQGKVEYSEIERSSIGSGKVRL